MNCGWVSTAHVEFIQNGKKGRRLSKQGAFRTTLAKLEKILGSHTNIFFILACTKLKVFESHHEQGHMGTWVCSDKLPELR